MHLKSILITSSLFFYLDKVVAAENGSSIRFGIEKFCSFENLFNVSCENTWCPCRVVGLECAKGLCDCKLGYYPNFEDEKCARCPPHGFSCLDGCCARGLMCIEDKCLFPNEDLIRYTSSVALGMALLLGITAMATLIWKVCRHSFGNNQNRRSSIGSWTSINSIQRLVNDRLRDRPPTYYDAVARQRAEMQRALAAAEPPPAYSLFSTEESGRIYRIYDNPALDLKDDTPTSLQQNPPGETSEATTSELGRTSAKDGVTPPLTIVVHI